MLIRNNMRCLLAQLENHIINFSTYRPYRKMACCAFTAWVHGYLGVGNRRLILSCVVNKVRKALPESSGEYMGFIPVHDSPAEFMAFE